MAPRVLPDSPMKHELAALIGAQTPLDPWPEPKRLSRFDDRINPRWMRVGAAVKYSGINRSRLFKLIAEGSIKSACVKEHRHAKRGLRLIDRFSLDIFLETLSKPVEEQLVGRANELLLQEQELAKQQELLTQKQRTIAQQLARIRKENE
jgi:hypothetical protein